ncbi:MAG: type 4a pilus biogenesis protein PilO [Chitinispirillaceae bacterium]
MFLLIACAAALAFCAAMRYVALPQWASYSEKREKIEKYDFYISSTEGFDKVKEEIDRKNVLLKRKLDSIPSRIPSRSISNILEELISRARKEDIQFSKIQPQKETRKDGLTEIPVLLQMRTDYHSLGRFVASLETLPQILQVSRLALQTENTGKLDINILVTCLIPNEEKS